MILINFCPPTDEFYKECNTINKYSVIIDFYNMADISKINVKTLNRKDFPELNIWLFEARKNYLAFINNLSQAKLSNKCSIRDYKLFDFPIYWLTPISEKQPRTHWLLSYFLFLEFLKSNYFTNEKTVVFLNYFIVDLKEKIIEYNINNKLKRNLVFIENKKSINLLWLIKKYITIQIKAIKKLNKIKKSNANNLNQENNIQIISLATNRLFYKQFETFEPFEKYQKIGFKPLEVFNLNNNDFNNISAHFFFFKPNIFTHFFIFFKSLLVTFKLYFFNQKILIDKQYFPFSFIKHELYDTLNYSQIYFSIYIWYKHYFKSIKQNCIFILEDEFYRFGRVITKAFKDANNKNIKLFGLQHGMFSPSHTVYMILEKELEEINKDDSLPLPYKFIVWGNYFKEIFEKQSYINQNYTLALGNPYYIQLRKKILNYDIKKGNYMLWCTTGPEQFLFELNFIQHLINRYNLKLLIRKHPSGHINDKFIEDKLRGINYRIDYEKDIFESILNSEFVITSAHSTVVLDCLICNKKVFRIIFDRDDDEFPDNIENLINVKTINDIDNANNTKSGFHFDLNKYLYLKDDQWKNFINNNLEK